MLLSASTMLVAPLLLALGVGAQSEADGCLRLLGSVACPAFQYAYLSPSNLSNAFPFFEGVTDVRSFDAAALNYFSDPFQFRTTKFVNQLGCFNASQATIRYQRTVLCSMWVNEQWSAQCLSRYNGTSAATSQKMVCQSTCLEYSASETALVNNTVYCPGEDFTNGNRSFQLNKDFVDCTNWTSLATNNSATCVTGASNEGNCGYGSSTTELCDFCRGDDPDDCCYDGSVDISVCGYFLPVRASTTLSSSSPTSTSSSPSSTSTSSSPTSSSTANASQGALQNENTSSNQGLSGGQIAGIVVGSVLGGFFMLGKLVLLFWWCRRRQKRKERAAAAAGGNGRVAGQSPNSSEKGLLGSSPHGTNSSPTMGGDTLYAGSHAAKSAESGMSPHIGAGAAGGAAGAMAGEALGGGGGERSGVVLPRVRDENSHVGGFIETGAEVNVLWPYRATLPDELDLRPGMKIRVLRLYDDAWGTGEVISGGEASETGKQGAFPIVCVSDGSSVGSSNGSSGSH